GILGGRVRELEPELEVIEEVANDFGEVAEPEPESRKHGRGELRIVELVGLNKVDEELPDTRGALRGQAMGLQEGVEGARATRSDLEKLHSRVHRARAIVTGRRRLGQPLRAE